MNLSRILHVDDEPDIRELVDISLGFDTGLSVRSCSSGSEAISVAAEWSPDVILMDVMMPVMDGPATLGELRKRNETARIPVVFMTARAQAWELAHFLSLGPAGIISKSFDPMTLAASVKQYLNGVELAAGSIRRSPVDRRAEALAELSAKTGTN